MTIALLITFAYVFGVGFCVGHFEAHRDRSWSAASFALLWPVALVAIGVGRLAEKVAP